MFSGKVVRVFPGSFLRKQKRMIKFTRSETPITCISPVFYLISRNDNQADKMKIIADNTVPYLKGILEPIADVSYLDSKEFTPTNIKDADALIVRSIDKCTRELLEGPGSPHHDSHDRVRPYRYPLLREGRDHVEERPGLQRRFRGAICIILFGSRRPPQRRETSREDYRYRWRRPCREYRGEAMRGHGDACASQ